MSFMSPSRSFSSSSLSGSLGSRGGLFGSISPATIGNLANTLRPTVQINSSTFPPADDKETMKGLNDRLAGYLSKVRLLEDSNIELEKQIKEALMRKGAESDRDWSAYEKIMNDLRNQLQEMTMDNARLFLQIDNARLAADDFKVKFESEQAMRQGVEQDLAGLRKMLDDTYMGRMQLEGQIESMREELVFLKKSHEEDVANLESQISDSQVNVQMESKNNADLNETINNIRTQYERAAQKSREETEEWYKNKFDSITAEVTQNTEALQAGKTELNELRRTKQTLEIDLQALHNMIRSLEDSLRETEARYAHEVNGYNSGLVQLEGELGQVRAQVERQAAEYDALLNIKSKLEAEIATYHCLLEGVVDDEGDKNREEFSLEQALYAAPPPSVGLKKAIVITQEIVDRKGVSQSELEQNPTNHNNHVFGEEEELAEPLVLALELAMEKVKDEQEEFGEQLELAMEKAKDEQEEFGEQLELAMEKVKDKQEEFGEQLELAMEKAKDEQEEWGEQLELAMEKAKDEQEEWGEQLELAMEKAQDEQEEFGEQLELAMDKVKDEQEEWGEQLELAMEKAKDEQEEWGDQLELAMEKAKDEQEEFGEQLELAMEKAKDEQEEFGEQLELAMDKVKDEQEEFGEQLELQLELAMEKAKDEQEEWGEQLELAMEKAKDEQEEWGEQLELAMEKAQDEQEEFGEQLELAMEKAKDEQEEWGEQLELAMEKAKDEQEEWGEQLELELELAMEKAKDEQEEWGEQLELAMEKWKDEQEEWGEQLGLEMEKLIEEREELEEEEFMKTGVLPRSAHKIWPPLQ
ncbi:neurofilament light polypeptide isoform X21 [Carassius gibelio]|uniref:neurofilament light polypeptide isoform X20 n=1 Tax=Carassius gibelio TaxID=101364 RepID=UPI002278BFEC|nr:neurofilament light polypeptide isoform X20 [Carassius gibelio]XP_052462636.1 neurofilament light polypeptide isoform X21 [Carassius gibelio]